MTDPQTVDPLTCPGAVPVPGPAPCGRDQDHRAHPLGRPPAVDPPQGGASR